MVKVCLYPLASGPDEGEGGVGRVIRAQLQHLPSLGVEFVDNPKDADVIHTHITAPPAWLNLYPEKPWVHSLHGWYWSEYEWAGWCYKANASVMDAVRIADIVTSPSDWVTMACARHTSRRAVTINHGVDMDEWKGSKPARPAYVLWDKNRPDPVCDPEPMNEMARMLPGVQFVSTFGQEAPNVRLTGRVPYEEAVELTRGASVYLATSRETFGIGTLQALAAGVPVVGWRWGGTAEIMANSLGGILVTPGDHQALADAIQQVLADPTPYRAEARKTARRYSWEHASREYLGAYEAAIARHQTPVRTSVIVRAFNMEKWLPETIESVVAQTDLDWEMVIVDDASTDRTLAVATPYAEQDDRIRIVHNEENQYLSGAMNTGIAAARGRYILPLDADDQLTPDAIGALAAALDTDRTIHMAYGNVAFMNPDGGQWHSGWPVPFSYDAQLHRRNQMPYSTMFRRQVWEDTAGYRTRCRTAEDADFWTRAASYGFVPKMVTQADTLIYRTRTDSVSVTHGTRDYESWFPWAGDPARSPAGSVVGSGQLPIPSLDPPVIAVVIPVGPTHGRYVMDAIDSVEAQTFRQWEVIVANDSGEPLPPLPPWVRAVEGEWGNVAAARNAAIAASSARLILPLDADDYLQPRALQLMLDAHDQCGSAMYSDFFEDPDTPGEFKVYQVADWDCMHLIRHGLPGCVVNLFPRAWWVEAGGYDPEIACWEDWAFALRLAELGHCFARIAAPLWTYRKHTGLRRADNLARRDEGEASIRARFGRYWEGEPLMACGCQGSKTWTPVNSPTAMDAPARNGEDMVLVSYTGGKQGALNWRGAEGVTYRFADGDKFYVFERDLGLFQGKIGFSIESPSLMDANSAVLVAEGPPA